MILMFSSRSVWATIKTLRLVDVPMVTNRCSDAEWSGSENVTAKGSPKIVEASKNETRCFREFRAALAGSHSKFTGSYYARALTGRNGELAHNPTRLLLSSFGCPASFARRAVRLKYFSSLGSTLALGARRRDDSSRTLRRGDSASATTR